LEINPLGRIVIASAERLIAISIAENNTAEINVPA
jgi:hypothetical protein